MCEYEPHSLLLLMFVCSVACDSSTQLLAAFIFWCQSLLLASCKWKLNVPCKQIANVFFCLFFALFFTVTALVMSTQHSASAYREFKHPVIYEKASAVVENVQPTVSYTMEVFTASYISRNVEWTLNQFPTLILKPIISIWYLCCVCIFCLYVLFCVL